MRFFRPVAVEWLGGARACTMHGRDARVLCPHRRRRGVIFAVAEAELAPSTGRAGVPRRHDVTARRVGVENV